MLHICIKDLTFYSPLSLLPQLHALFSLNLDDPEDKKEKDTPIPPQEESDDDLFGSTDWGDQGAKTSGLIQKEDEEEEEAEADDSEP